MIKIQIGYEYFSDTSRAPRIELVTDHDIVELKMIDDDCANMLINCIENTVFDDIKVIDWRPIQS